MGYETVLHLVGVRIAAKHRPRVEQLLRKSRQDKKDKLRYILGLVDFTSDDTLEFRSKKLPAPEASEVPDEEGFVISAAGKCYESEDFAVWLCKHRFEGAIVEHSREGDSEAWGWEFKNGRIRYLVLRPKGPWLRPGER